MPVIMSEFDAGHRLVPLNPGHLGRDRAWGLGARVGLI